ncbi:MAG: DUF1722 domain-containing protein, partial [Tissierellia bacterium]|nr:DUF1722 domain-containing protein [Tissierellia bacterium]
MKLQELEEQWSKEKYEILSKSQKEYLKIRKLFATKDYEPILKTMEEAKTLPFSKGNAVNAAEHIWGYFKKFATDFEKQKFQELIQKFQNEEIEEQELRNYLKELLKKYP